MTAPGPWVEQALCAGYDPETFHTDMDREAKAICNRCPVIDPCLNYALTATIIGTQHVSGVWGGTTDKERHAMRMAQQRLGEQRARRRETARR